MGFTDGGEQSLLARNAGARDDPELVIVDFGSGARHSRVGAVQAPASVPIAANDGAPR
jgi:hypothetical protein